MSVRIVFGAVCDDSKLELRGGVHQDHVEHILFFTKQKDLITISLQNRGIRGPCTLAAEQRRAPTHLF